MLRTPKCQYEPLGWERGFPQCWKAGDILEEKEPPRGEAENRDGAITDHLPCRCCAFLGQETGENAGVGDTGGRMRAELSGDRKEGTWQKEEGWGCREMERVRRVPIIWTNST